MRVAIAYRGVFNFQRINRVGVDSDILSDIQEVLDNHKDNLYNVFDNVEPSPTILLATNFPKLADTGI